MPASPTRTRPAVVVFGLLVCAGLIVFRASFRPAIPAPPPRSATGKRTVDDRVREYGEIVRQRLEPDFARAHVPYPPAALTLIGLKQEKTLQIYAADRDHPFRFIRAYPILAASSYAPAWVH